MAVVAAAHCGSEQPDFDINHTLSHELGSEWVSKQMNERSGACEQSEQGEASRAE